MSEDKALVMGHTQSRDSVAAQGWSSMHKALGMWVWWCSPIIPAHWKKGQEKQKFKFILGYIESSRLTWATGYVSKALGNSKVTHQLALCIFSLLSQKPHTHLHFTDMNLE